LADASQQRLNANAPLALVLSVAERLFQEDGTTDQGPVGSLPY